LDSDGGTQKNGLEAVDKINHDNDRFDLIFMDIIMPQLDGVSATAMIRMVAPRVPIIAMTSNIRQEDITTYFGFGKPKSKKTCHLPILTFPRNERCSGEAIHQGRHGPDLEKASVVHVERPIVGGSWFG